jgi:N6-L-threonylcarbamoyladenine synthase
MTVFALETSCDETSAAVVRDGRVISNVVASQVALHAEYGGVVPDLATREHLRNLQPLARTALQEAGLRPGELQAVAATRGPGLPNALMIGMRAGQAMAYALQKPFYGIHHHEAHLYSAWIAGDPPKACFEQFKPSVSLIASGGHTLLVHVERELRHRLLGGTLDDAAGECFDKVAKLIGLPYPGGPALEKKAAQGDPAAYLFPRPLMQDATDQFSFSGLKTAVRYFLQKNPALVDDHSRLCDVCASVQAAIVEVLVVKTVRAARRLGVKCVTASGGVTCNQALRQGLTVACQRHGLELRLSDRIFCTDNAGMVAVLAERKLISGHAPTPVDAEIVSNWSLEEL